MEQKLDHQKKFNASYMAIKPRRDQKIEDIKLYNNQSKNDSIISNSLLYSTVNTLLSITYNDEMQVDFKAREYGDYEREKTLRSIAKFDHDEMDLSYSKFLKAKDRLLMGVSIEFFDGWNKENNTPTYTLIDPLSWYPDPRGHTHVKNFRYMGFEIETDINTLKAMGGYKNLDQINTNTSSKLTEVKLGNDVANNLQTTQDFEHNESKDIILYVHLDRDEEWYPTCYTYANNVDLLIKEERIKLISPLGKKKPHLAEYPVILNYRMPARFDPFGKSVPDEMRDKNKALTILDNLRLIAEKDASIGIGIEILKGAVDPKHVINRNPFATRVIPTTQMGSVQHIRWGWPTQTSFNTSQGLERDAQVAVWSGSNQSWVTNDTKLTATEIQAAQNNSNLRQLLNVKLDELWEKQWWELWMMSYDVYFSEKDEKLVRVNGWLRDVIKVFHRWDIVSIKSPDIKVVSKMTRDKEREKRKVDVMTTAAIDLQDPELSPTGKKEVRKLVKSMQGWSDDEIEVLYPRSAQELQAYDDVLLINEGETIKVEDLNEDHQTFIAIYQTAIDWKAKTASIYNRRQALKIKEMIQKEQPQQENGAANQAQAQFSNTAIQKQNEKESMPSNISNL